MGNETGPLTHFTAPLAVATAKAELVSVRIGLFCPQLPENRDKNALTHTTPPATRKSSLSDLLSAQLLKLPQHEP
jgi:hypothetical protein